MAPFYIVWNPEGPHAPKFRHESFEAARAEAERLALAHPGDEFFVMESHSRSTTTRPVETVYYDTDGIPF